MGNSFTKLMDNSMSFKYTENGALARNTTYSYLYDLFAFGGAYRNRDKNDRIRLFANAFAENPVYAVRCLFYLRDVRGGQGERTFFRDCFEWLAINHSNVAKQLIKLVPEYGRWDDVIYLLDKSIDSNLRSYIYNIIIRQLLVDAKSDHPSLLAKWMPSENASSAKTKQLARKIRQTLGITSEQYRKLLSQLRKKINLVESQMSQDRWEDIEFDKVPSKAGLLYSNAFKRNEKTRDRYIDFINSKDTKVKASTLYPSEIVSRALSSRTNDEVVNKFWKNLPDYFNGKSSSMMCVCDTSGSMYGDPIRTAIALTMYAAERNHGDFHNYFITFSSHPSFVKIGNSGFASEARIIENNCINSNTNLDAVFELLRRNVLNGNFEVEDMPKTLVIISDMEIDSATRSSSWAGDNGTLWDINNAATQMEQLRKEWAEDGLKLPKLVYWNVDARHDTILDLGPDVSLVSGKSPVLFEQICTGKTGHDLMMDKLESERYNINFEI